MKKISVILIALYLIACQKNDIKVTHEMYPKNAAVAGSWRQMLDTSNIELIASPFFSIGDTGYVINQRNNEVYKYDPKANLVTKLRSFPGQRRLSDATALSIGSKGYYGFGLGQKSLVEGSQTQWDYQYFTDFWEYDPGLDSWTQITSPPIPANIWTHGVAFLGAYAFGIGTKGYIGSGGGINFAIQPYMLVYDQPTKTWTRNQDSASYVPLYSAIKIAFTVSSKGYGYIGDSTTLWEFHPDDKSYGWYKVKPTPVSLTTPAVSISGKSKGYIYGSITSLNSQNPVMKNEFYEYVPTNNRDANSRPLDGGSWNKLSDFAGQPRASCPGFLLNGKVYVGFGSDLKATTLGDMWEYTP